MPHGPEVQVLPAYHVTPQFGIQVSVYQWHRWEYNFASGIRSRTHYFYLFFAVPSGQIEGDKGIFEIQSSAKDI